MDYKKEIVNKLRSYVAIQESLVTSADEIQRLRMEMGSIRSASSDGTPVSGGTNRREERLINNIALRSEMEHSRQNAKEWLRIMDNAMKKLDPEESRILDIMYIHTKKNAVMRLMDELNIEKATVYYRRDKALRHFALLFYGEDQRV